MCRLRYSREGQIVNALLIDAVVRDGDVHVTDALYKTRRQRAAKKWGDGAALKIRIEPEEDAVLWSQYKHLYGHLYEPVSKRHGETKADVNLRMKLQFMPDDGRTSLTQLNRDEMKSFIESVEQDIREHDPDSWGDCLDAMALYEQRSPNRQVLDLAIQKLRDQQQAQPKLHPARKPRALNEVPKVG